MKNTTNPAEPVAASAARQCGAVQRRWQILYEQMDSGHEPCFSSDRRATCKEDGCKYRSECTAMRAAWRR